MQPTGRSSERARRGERQEDGMSWEPEVEEIKLRRRIAYEMGGEEAVSRHHAKGELTIRERIDRLVDAGSFREYGVLSGRAEYDEEGRLESFQPSNAVIGLARIGGRGVVVGGEDATLRGGASDGGGSAKSYYLDTLARQYRVPLIRLHESGGGSVRTNRSSHSGRAMSGDTGNSPYIDLMGSVPVVAAAMGPAAGIAAARMALAHFSVMLKETAVIFAGGPPVVERALGQRLTKEELGGWKVAAYSGLVNNVAEDEEDCFRQIQTFLSYLPSNAWEPAPRCETGDDPQRADEALLSLIPRDRQRGYDPKRLVRHVVDEGSFFEMTPYFGRALVTGLARVDGYPIGVIASNPNWFGGAMDAEASDKIERFVDMCDSFHLPLLSFEDDPGYMIGLQAEKAGTLRRGIRAMAAVKQATVPWINFIVRKAYGVAAGAHHNGNGPVYAWPSGEWGSIPVEGGVAAAFRREIESAEDPDAKRLELERQFNRDRNPFLRAESFGLHDLVDPRETRPIVSDWVNRVQVVLRTELGPKTRMMRP
jgi:acetyl-CoA carboxylase carboxyltransferase component